VGFVEENPAAMMRLRAGGYHFLAEKEFLNFVG